MGNMNIQEAINVIEAMRLDFNCDGRRSDIILEARNVILEELKKGLQLQEELEKIKSQKEDD